MKKSSYDANVDIPLTIKDSSNTIVYTKTDPSVTVPFGGTSHSFAPWTPTIADIYSIQVTTNVNDCKCASSSPSTTSTSVQITSPPPQCPTCQSATSWSTCVKNLTNQYSQTRTNYKCDSTTNYQCQQYTETQSCTISTTCTPNWNCAQWSQCTNNQQSRTCTDLNNCNTLTGRPALMQSCSATACTENWQCSSWSECKNNEQTRTCEDLNKCGTTANKPSIIQNCTLQQAQPQAEKSLAEKLSFLTQPTDQNVSTIKVLMQYQTGLPITIIVLVLLIAGFLLYYEKEHKKPKHLKLKQSEKEELKPVRPSDLLLDVIEHLDEYEKVICNKLLEGEGIRQNDLRNALGIPKVKFEIALQKLERRNIIKEREGENSKIFFNDWIK